MLNSVQVLQHCSTESQAQQTAFSVSHTDGRSVGHLTEELQSVAASHFVPLCIILQTVGLAGGTLCAICSCPWLLGCTGSEEGSRRRGCRGAFHLRAESLLSNRQRRDDLWIEALWRLQWLRGRRITEGNGNVSFTWRLRGWMPLCWATRVSVIGKIDSLLGV